MAIFDRLNTRVVVAGAGLCGIAMALSPEAAAVPLITGGDYACIQGQAGAAPAGAVCTASAPLADMAGIPMALPGPVPVAPPVAPPLPAAPPIPVVPAAPVAPAAAPLAAGASLSDMSGLGGKGDPTGPAPDGAPVAGKPLAPGPYGS
jgi:hypothetical protein